MGKKIELSKRLRLVASFVEYGAVVADVGTDHGYVPIWLVQEGVAAGGIAMDVKPGPLERAKSHIAACGLTDRIRTRLGDGLSSLSGEEADTVIIAGMGGPLIVRILTEGLETAREMKRLILSPQSEIWSVRAFLEQNGFVIEDEAMVKEAGKYYTVICARFGGGYIECGTGYDDLEIKEDAGKDGEKRRLKEKQNNDVVKREKCPEWKYGRKLIEKKDPVLLEFLKEERQKYQRILDRLYVQKGLEKSGQQERKAEVEEEIALIEEVFHRMGYMFSEEDDAGTMTY